MSDEKEYIERGAFLRKCAEAWGHYGVTIKAIEGIADECKAADVVEVVRCKDCKENPNYRRAKGIVWCRKFRADVHEDGFCSYGGTKEQT